MVRGAAERRAAHGDLESPEPKPIHPRASPWGSLAACPVNARAYNILTPDYFLAANAAKTFSGVTGISWKSTPMASWMALRTAGATPTTGC